MIKKIGLGLLAAIVLGVAFFFLYVVKTPYYSLYRIHTAVQTHDAALFQKHVDLDSIYGNGVDDLIVSGVKGKPNFGVDIFAAALIKMVKPVAVQAMRDATLESVKKVKAAPAQKVNGQAVPQTDKQDSKKKSKWEDQIPLLKKVKEKLDVSNLKIRDASVTQTANGVAELAVVLHDIRNNKDYDVNMRMEQLYDGEWQIKEITNFVEVMTEMEEAAKQEVNESVNESWK